MEKITSGLKKAWDSIGQFETGSLSIGIEHPLDWYVACEAASNKALVIVSKWPIETIDSSKSIDTVCNKRADGSYYISFQLLEKSQEDVFISMCSNLIEYSSNALSERDALKKVAFRYRQWRRLMEYRNLAILSDSKRRGLIGELLYLKATIEGPKSDSEALAGWVGPDGADQDFVYDGIWREIKTTGLSSDQIAIHSIEQLGEKDEKGELYIYRVDPCAPEADGAFTLRALIKSIIQKLNGDANEIEGFMNKLSAIGYIDMEAYDEYYYKYFRQDAYLVDQSFPRITRIDVRPEVTNAEYTISISSIEHWKRG